MRHNFISIVKCHKQMGQKKAEIMLINKKNNKLEKKHN